MPCIFPTAQAREPAADIVTMSNGNIHVGLVKQGVFELETNFGLWQIDYPSMKTLILAPDKQNAQIITIRDEHITGTAITRRIEISRLQSPPIPVTLQDIARVDFGSSQPIDMALFSSRIQTNTHDNFRVQVDKTDITLKTEKGNIKLALNDLRYLDAVYRTDDETLLLQATLHTGEVYQGQAYNESIRVSSPYLAGFDFPLEHLSRLSVKSREEQSTPTTFIHNMYNLGSGPKMLKLKGGSFLRGDHQGNGDTDEQPLSIVSIQPFAIGQFEITFDEFDLFCEQTGRNKPDDQDWGRGTRPVINVSWLDALAYVEWLADKTDKPYRLPSDAEWEFAARAGQNSRFWWGDEPDIARANCEGCGSLWDGDQTAPVGRFQENQFGLYDTAGNVFEWVADCHHDRFADAPKDGSPVEKPACGKRVIRGGAWSFPAHEIRSANRWRDFPSRISDDTGFRVALDLH